MVFREVAASPVDHLWSEKWILCCYLIHLCTLYTYGRFLPKAVAALIALTNDLAQQLDLPLVLFGEVSERLAPETDHRQRIRTYLGWRLFDDKAHLCLARWLTQRATDDWLPSDLLSPSEDMLRSWQVVPPVPSTLEAIVASVTACVQDDVYTRIATGLTPELQRGRDKLLEVPNGERRSALFYLKTYPPQTSNTVVLRYIERYPLPP